MKRKVLSFVSKWRDRGYPIDIPDEALSELERQVKAPSYRMICKAILSNDLALTSLGFSRECTPEYMAFKKIEIEARK